MSELSSKLTELLRSSLLRHPSAGKLWLGYSGGLDSAVLLHLLARAGIPVTALYIHHGLSERAAEWQVHCESQALKLGVPFVSREVRVDRSDGGLEQGARNARYLAFEQCMAPGDQILLAHHGDDQAETFFLRLLRGAGVLGLGAMPECRPLGRKRDGRSLLRPLLKATRSELESYAREHGLTWVEDESNADLSIDRNYLRSQVLSSLTERWPLQVRVEQASENLREAADLLSDLASEDLQRCGCRQEPFGHSIDLVNFSALTKARRKNLLRGWLGRVGSVMPEAAHLDEALRQAEAADDAVPEVTLGERVLRRYRDRLFLTPQLQPLNGFDGGEAKWNGKWNGQWDGSGELILPGSWALAPSQGWPVADYQVRFRVGGERAKPRERHHSQTLKKLLQEYGLPPWLRDRVPLVYRGEALVAVGDLFTTPDGPSQPPIWRFLD
ncbi:tRNA lysidine(34) synthetase TilS [Microbulbifer sp. ALW1]|uniref:tRNA lysidine(34) synthetase TilS n=1 Tax=Microbulbifer sp. (strain ALW1) TaxID=1516059 RepID=UPI001358192C|nr:tRNA lysidine(34) synthetase TilS [Microbulbifer sp. ALW1]